MTIRVPRRRLLDQLEPRRPVAMDLDALDEKLAKRDKSSDIPCIAEEIDSGDEPSSKRQRITRSHSQPLSQPARSTRSSPSPARSLCQSLPSSPISGNARRSVRRSPLESPLAWQPSNAEICRAIVDSIHQRQYTEQPLELFKDLDCPARGHGVRCRSDVSRNAFVCEYAGELISEARAQDRESEYEREIPSPGCYMFYFVHSAKRLCIDSTRVPADDVSCGALLFGYGRYINHARRRANLVGKVVVDSKGRPRLCFFAKRSISANEELLIDYGDRDRENIKANPWLAD